MKPVRLSLAAENDLYEIVGALIEKSTVLGSSFLDEYEKLLLVLSEFPQVGRIRDDIAQGVRSLLLAGRWLAIYRDEPDEVVIIRIVWGQRDLGSLHF